jgi:hypothetical protein
MADMDSVEAPYGDILALHPSHCFIPTVSALDLDVTDLFYDVASDPEPGLLTSFDAIYYPLENQEHVFIDAQTAAWLTAEILMGAVGVGEGAAPSAGLLSPPVPNPMRASGEIRFTLAEPGPVRLEILSVDGGLVRVLSQEVLSAGEHPVRWDGRDASGREVAGGVYFVKAATEQGTAVQRVTVLR